MRELAKINGGFGDLEKFNLGIISKLRSDRMKGRGEEISMKMISSAMSVKLRDEERYRERARNCMRRSLGVAFGKNSKPFRNAMKVLRAEAAKVKTEYEKNNRTKIIHLQKKYREEEKVKIDKVPESLKQYSGLSIFSENKY